MLKDTASKCIEWCNNDIFLKVNLEVSIATVSHDKNPMGFFELDFGLLLKISPVANARV